jgi:beta-barrel assembly-enhancing protease
MTMRRFILAGSAIALVAAAPTRLNQPISGGYQPQDQDERGLWMQVEEAERDVKASNFVIRDPDLNTYVRAVFCRTVTEERCRDVRIYLLRTPVFNAAMYPNGMMVVYSGLFLRVRNEAQLAAVLGHEFTHYANRHSLRNFRDIRSKTNALAILNAVPLLNYGAAAAMTVLQYGVLGSIFGFSREMEREADAGSLPLMANAGYDLSAASAVWEQIRAEQDATALARGKKSHKDKEGGMFATHPSTAERMAELRAMATKQTIAGTPKLNRDAYRKALAPHWSFFIDDQVKLNDFGATEFLLEHLAVEGWTPDLLYARGELYRSRGRPEDLLAAARLYRQATADPSAPVEAYRGLGLALLRSGVQAEGQAALKTYLTRRPDASDRAMIAMMAGEQK